MTRIRSTFVRETTFLPSSPFHNDPFEKNLHFARSTSFSERSAHGYFRKCGATATRQRPNPNRLI